MHMDVRQLAVFRSWLDDWFTWEENDATARRLRELLAVAEKDRNRQKIYVADHPGTCGVEYIVGDVIGVEKRVRGDDGPDEVNRSLELVAVHVGQRLQFLLGEQIVSLDTVLEKAGFPRNS